MMTMKQVQEEVNGTSPSMLSQDDKLKSLQSAHTEEEDDTDDD